MLVFTASVNRHGPGLIPVPNLRLRMNNANKMSSASQELTAGMLRKKAHNKTVNSAFPCFLKVSESQSAGEAKTGKSRPTKITKSTVDIVFPGSLSPKTNTKAGAQKLTKSTLEEDLSGVLTSVTLQTTKSSAN